MEKGEIYYINNSPFYNPQGTELQKDRPGVIVSTNEINEIDDYGFVVIPLTSKPKYFSDFHCTIHSSGRPSTVLTEQIRYCDKNRLGDYIGTVTEEEMEEIQNCIRKLFDIRINGNDKTAEVEALKKTLSLKNKEIERIKNGYNTKVLEMEAELKVYKQLYDKMTAIAINGTEKK